MIAFALCMLAVALFPLAVMLADDRRRVRDYKAYRAAEDARLAARTEDQKRIDAQIACLLVAGFIPDSAICTNLKP